MRTIKAFFQSIWSRFRKEAEPTDPVGDALRRQARLFQNDIDAYCGQGRYAAANAEYDDQESYDNWRTMKPDNYKRWKQRRDEKEAARIAQIWRGL